SSRRQLAGNLLELWVRLCGPQPGAVTFGLVVAVIPVFCNHNNLSSNYSPMGLVMKDPCSEPPRMFRRYHSTASLEGDRLSGEYQNEERRCACERLLVVIAAHRYLATY